MSSVLLNCFSLIWIEMGPSFPPKIKTAWKVDTRTFPIITSTHTISPQRSIHSIWGVGSPKDLRKDYSTIINSLTKVTVLSLSANLTILIKWNSWSLIKQNLRSFLTTRRSPERAVWLRISLNLDRTILLMMPQSKRYYLMLLILMFSTVFPSYINLDALFAVLFPLLTLTTTIMLIILFVYLRMSPPTSLLSRTLLVLLNGLWHTATTTSSCALLMFRHCSPMFHLIRPLKLLETNYMPRLIHLSYLALLLIISLFLLPREVILCLITSSMIKLTGLQWDLLWVQFLQTLIFCTILKKSECWITLIALLSGLDCWWCHYFILQQEHSY